MAEFGTTSAKIVLPIFTKVGDGDYVHLGDAEMEMPMNLQSELPFMADEQEMVSEISEVLQSSLAPSIPTDGPHSEVCAVIPHQHGPTCHPNCPTCGNGVRPGMEAQATAIDPALSRNGMPRVVLTGDEGSDG